MYSLLLSFLDQQQANLIICMLLSIPLSFLLGLIKQKYLFLAFSMSITLSFQSFLFPTQKYFLWIQQQIIYLLIIIIPRKYVGHAVLIQSFVALGCVQIRRIYLFYAVNGVDITGIFMMQLFVWVGMAYNYQNGRDQQPMDKLTDDAKRRVIKERPSYITYLGYVNFLPACLIGPVYQFRDFEDYINRENDYKFIPNPLKAMGKELGVFLITLIAYVLTMKFTLDYILTQEYSQLNIVFKLAYVSMSLFHIQLKYISAWSLGLISMKASGFTYNPTMNKVNQKKQIIQYNFQRVKITSFKKFFIMPSMKDKAEGWNISVQAALRKYIYEQIHNPMNTYKDQKQRIKTTNRAQLATLMTSALWHGFYFGYFLTFFHWSLLVQVSAQLYKLRLRSQKFKIFYQKYYLCIVQSMLWNFLIMYFGAITHFMIWSRIKIFLNETYYLPFFFTYGVWVVVVKMRVLNKFGKRDRQVESVGCYDKREQDIDRNKVKQN